MKCRDGTTRVVFRVDQDGTVFALFPDDPATDAGHVTSYQHIGQHGAADYAACVRSSRSARPDEYADLADELRDIGYTLRVMRRRA